MTAANNMQCVAVVNWPLNDWLYPQDVQNLFFPPTSAWVPNTLTQPFPWEEVKATLGENSELAHRAIENRDTVSLNPAQALWLARTTTPVGLTHDPALGHVWAFKGRGLLLQLAQLDAAWREFAQEGTVWKTLGRFAGEYVQLLRAKEAPESWQYIIADLHVVTLQLAREVLRHAREQEANTEALQAQLTTLTQRLLIMAWHAGLDFRRLDVPEDNPARHDPALLATPVGWLEYALLDLTGLELDFQVNVVAHGPLVRLLRLVPKHAVWGVAPDEAARRLVQHLRLNLALLRFGQTTSEGAA